MSVDHLALGVGARTKAFEHRALFYRTDEEFRSVTLPFVDEGLARGHAEFDATSNANRAKLEAGLGDRRSDVRFLDSTEWYSDPSSTLGGYRRLVDEQVASGYGRIRVVGEPVWAGRSPEETNRWHRYESMINLVFASSPATILCPYDAGSLAPGIIETAQRTHPEVSTAADVASSPDFRDPASFLLG